MSELASACRPLGEASGPESQPCWPAACVAHAGRKLGRVDRLARSAAGSRASHAHHASTRTKKRRNLDIIVAGRQMKTESTIGEGEFRVTTINGIAGKARLIAQIFPVRSTKNAFAIGPAEPRNANTVANLEF